MSEFDEGRGFVLLFRKIDEWGWYKDSKTFHLFCHILLHVNYKQKEWKGIKIPAGTMITSVANLSAQTGMTPKSVRVALEHLKNSGEVAIETAKTYTRIKVVKWREYQGEGANSRAKRGQSEGKAGAKQGQQLNKGNKGNKGNNSSLTAADRKSDFLKILLPETEVRNPAETESVFRAYMKASPTRLTEAVAEQLQALVDEYGEDKVLTSIDKAVRQGSVRLAYIEAILRDKGGSGKAKAPERTPYDILMR